MMKAAGFQINYTRVINQFIRHVSTVPNPGVTTAAEAASYLMENVAGKVIQRRQVIDANQLQKLAFTLGRPIVDGHGLRKNNLPLGTPIPAGHHLVYFTPDFVEAQLSPDGTDDTFNAPTPFTRRMWAGGQMTFYNDKSLRVGDEAEEHSKLIRATAKKSRSAGEMVLVEVEKDVYGSEGLALKDRRSWIFRPLIDITQSPNSGMKTIDGSILESSSMVDIKVDDDVFPVRQTSWSPVALFRFSALTFNAHKIHYNEEWTRTYEGHPGVVVHGPLNLISLLDYWRDIHGDGSNPDEITYRAVSPVYAGERYNMRTAGVVKVDGLYKYEVLAEKDGRVIMQASIVKAG